VLDNLERWLFVARISIGPRRGLRVGAASLIVWGFYRQTLEVGTDERLRRRRIGFVVAAVELRSQEDHECTVVNELPDSESSQVQDAD
jgi:hypothetical protein